MLERGEVIGKAFEHGNYAADYTESDYKSMRQNLMMTITPSIKTLEQPVQLFDRQHVSFVAEVGRGFGTLGLHAL